MATVADTLGSGGGRAGKVGGKIRRKTPSELRGEQLKRVNVIELCDESPAPSCCGFEYGTVEGSGNGPKMEAFKLPRYINMRVDEVFPAKKSRFGVPMAKENAKKNKSVEQAGNERRISVVSEMAGKRKELLSSSESSKQLPEASENVDVQADKINEKYSQSSRFRTVAEISSSRQNLSSLGTIDMKNKSVEQAGNERRISVVSEMAGKRKELLSSSECSKQLPEASENVDVQADKINEKYSQSSRFRTVAEISSSRQNLSSLGTIDMDKALKGLATLEPLSHSPGDPVEGFNQSSCTNTNNFDREYSLTGSKAPLDCTLKTMMRVVTCSSVKWIYKLVTDCNPSKANNSPSYSWNDETTNGDCPGMKTSLKNLSSEALNSWIYPQSTLPPSLVSVLTSHAIGKVELDFWRKRQVAWEESFRSLYYLLRKNVCHIFYVCTVQFVVMFTTDDDPVRKKHTSRAYISRSTRGLRSLLREHDICFSMPLCQTKVEQVASEDLMELSEIEKHNLGQVQRPSVFSDIDNSSQSLLVVSGTKDVHGLYDVLLNYRCFITFLSGLDVPVLYSPIPFHNAAVSTPEVRCLEKKRGDCIASIGKENTNLAVAAEGPSNCLEIVGAYLPPWTICNICALVCSQGTFETSFHTESTSVGLNAALGLTGECLDLDTASAESLEKVDPFGISAAVVTPPIKQGQIRSLKYCDGSYKFTLTPT